ncbi:hypothetical protein ACFOY2_39435 [Nonomuraea purpurea]|uniref:Uncharacterized protein n=1 Tax=Nonomuraea purpurea TaxID=1849276 RepID=A0ABV8GHD8_9ACTN
MGSDLRGLAAGENAVHSAEFIVSSARLGELRECSALLRRTRMRSEEIVDEARALLAEAERSGDDDRVHELREQYEKARSLYGQVLTAYVTLNDKIAGERQEIFRTQLRRERPPGLSGVA